MSDIVIHCNEEKGQKFIKDVKGKEFLFSFVTSYTETACEIPGITVAGAKPDLIKYHSIWQILSFFSTDFVKP